MTDREIISTLASMNPLRPCHHLPTQPLRRLLPSPAPTHSPKIDNETPRPPEAPPPHRGRDTETPSPRSLQPSTASHARQRKTPVMTGSGVQNTCHTFQS